MTKIILDTNSLIHCIENKINYYVILEEKLGYVEFFILKQSLDELKKIEIKPRIKKLVLEIINKDTKIIEYKPEISYVDQLIIDYTKENSDFVVFTQDKELLKKLKSEKINSCYISKNKRINYQ
ncbi:MAG: ribonuclease VapC [Candidatus Nanoarchaeia archaeon]|nr:ribonuclease VapC [Candidatus Nanoarchaeia archaeon]